MSPLVLSLGKRSIPDTTSIIHQISHTVAQGDFCTHTLPVVMRRTDQQNRKGRLGDGDNDMAYDPSLVAGSDAA